MDDPRGGRESGRRYLALQKNLTRCSSRHGASNKFLDVCPEGGTDDSFMDRRTADYAKTAMKIARTKRAPFFVAAGFYRPHLRWHVPKRFYDLYASTSIRTPRKSRFAPAGMPDVAWANEGAAAARVFITSRARGAVAGSGAPSRRGLAAPPRARDRAATVG